MYQILLRVRAVVATVKVWSTLSVSGNMYCLTDWFLLILSHRIKHYLTFFIFGQSILNKRSHGSTLASTLTFWVVYMGLISHQKLTWDPRLTLLKCGTRKNYGKRRQSYDIDHITQRVLIGLQNVCSSTTYLIRWHFWKGSFTYTTQFWIRNSLTTPGPWLYLYYIIMNKK